jgi:hypothetical protein
LAATGRCDEARAVFERMLARRMVGLITAAIRLSKP